MKISTYQPKIIVVGSCSIDLVLKIDNKLEEGDTMLATKSENFFGGKGANEAVSVSRLGASAYFVGCVGMDPMGQQIMRHLVEEGVNVGYVKETANASTGSAYVMATGFNNTIVVDAAANACLTVNHIKKSDKYFHTADVVLLQLEIPMEVVEFTVGLAKKYGKKVGLYASPGKRISKEIIDEVDFIVVKKKDIPHVFGEKLTEELLLKYANRLFVREADNTTVFHNDIGVQSYSDEEAEVIYKMGMGDAFIAGFTVALCHDNTIEDCVRLGNKVALSVSQERGSQKGLPYLKDIKL